MWVRHLLVVLIGIAVAALFLPRHDEAPSPAADTRAASAAAVAALSAEEDTDTRDEVRTTTPVPNTYRVTKVVDGDTFVVDIDGSAVTVRLIGLDTPETVDPRKPVQCFGREASDKAKEILAGARVRLETDASQDTYDKYGRLLAYAFLPDGTLFNRYMIEEGFGHEYTYRTPYKYQTEFKAAEEAARIAKKGLWADDACERPEESAPFNAAPATTIYGSEISPGQYECDRNAYNCSDFSSRAEAQHVFELCGATANDVHRLDGDRDGSVCESLP
jgi:micrococcal nuclease